MLPKDPHRRVLQAGVRETLTQLRHRFWILRDLQLVKQEIAKCIPCQGLSPGPLTEAAASLPSDRTTEADSFKIVGIYFAGYFKVSAEESTKKAYLALFTCAVTRAIYSELVPDL